MSAFVHILAEKQQKQLQNSFDFSYVHRKFVKPLWKFAISAFASLLLHFAQVVANVLYKLICNISINDYLNCSLHCRWEYCLFSLCEAYILYFYSCACRQLKWAKAFNYGVKCFARTADIFIELIKKFKNANLCT